MDDEIVGRSCSDRAAVVVLRIWEGFRFVSSFERNGFVALVVLVSEKLPMVEYDLKKDHTQCMVLWSSLSKYNV